LKDECQDFDETHAIKGVSFEAFKALQKVLIQKMKQQTCWTILRHFGYNDKLQIRENLWDDGSIKDEELYSCKNIEVAKDANSYLKKLFDSNSSVQ
jgi:hypothetical protein